MIKTARRVIDKALGARIHSAAFLESETYRE